MSTTPAKSTSDTEPSPVYTTDKIDPAKRKLLTHIRHKFLFPFEVNGEKFEEVTITRPKYAERKEAMSKETDGERELFILSRCTAIPPDYCEHMDLADFHLINEVITGFTEARSAR